MSELDLDLIRKRAENATPGPWERQAYWADHSRYDMHCWVTVSENGDSICDMDSLNRSYNEAHDDDGYNDAEFIAHAREDVPALLAEVERLRARVDEFEGLDDELIRLRGEVEGLQEFQNSIAARMPEEYDGDWDQASLIDKWLDYREAELSEAKARAWDKGYTKGRDDGEHHSKFLLSHTPREPNSSRNPYRRPKDTP